MFFLRVFLVSAAFGSFNPVVWLMDLKILLNDLSTSIGTTNFDTKAGMYTSVKPNSAKTINQILDYVLEALTPWSFRPNNSHFLEGQQSI